MSPKAKSFVYATVAAGMFLGCAIFYKSKHPNLIPVTHASTTMVNAAPANAPANAPATPTTAAPTPAPSAPTVASPATKTADLPTSDTTTDTSAAAALKKKPLRKLKPTMTGTPENGAVESEPPMPVAVVKPAAATGTANAKMADDDPYGKSTKPATKKKMTDDDPFAH